MMPLQSPFIDNFDIHSNYSDSIIAQNAFYNNSTNNKIISKSMSTRNVSTSTTPTTMTPKKIASKAKTIRSNSVQIKSSDNDSILKEQRNLLSGRSIQSLCSCDADTEIDLDQTRPLYQYSWDRKNRNHTYTCEQNAQILVRLEREHQKKIQANKLKNAKEKDTKLITYETNQCDYPTTYPENTRITKDNSYLDIDLLPPPPPPPTSSIPLSRKSSFNQNNKSFHLNQQQFQSNDSIKLQNFTTPTSIPIGTPTIDTTTTISSTKSPVLNYATIHSNSMSSNRQQPHRLFDKNNNNEQKKPTLLSTLTSSSTFNINNNNNNYDTNKNNKHYLNNQHQSTSKLNQINDTITQCFKNKTDGSLYFYHHEPPQYIPNYETDHQQYYQQQCQPPLQQQQQQQQAQPQAQEEKHQYSNINSQCYHPPNNYTNFHNSNNYDKINSNSSSSKQEIPGKFNTIGPSSHSYYLNNDNKINLNNSTCNLTTQIQSNNLISGRYFSNSLSAINSSSLNANYHQQQHPQQQKQHQQQQQQQQYHQHHHPNHLYNNHNSHYIDDSGHISFVQYPDENLSSIVLCGDGGTSCNIDDSGGININNNRGIYTSATTASTILANSLGGAGGGGGSGGGNIFCGSSTGLYNGKMQQQQHQQQQQQQHQQKDNIPWRHRQCPSVGSNSSGTSITKWDPTRHWLAVTSILLIAGAAGVAVPLALRVTAGAPFEERLQVATQLLNAVPLIDGHNDLPWNIRQFIHNKLNNFNFDSNLKEVSPWSKSKWSHTDLLRLKKGQISAQFWAAYVPCETKYTEAVRMTLEQIDVIFRITEKYSPQLTTCTSVMDIIEAHKNHQLCSLTGVEGGHSLAGSLGVLRTYYTLGVRYMTLTSTCHTPWADSSIADAPKFEVKHGGLTAFGKTIIREMNRLGMIVDLSHVSVATMRDALSVSEAPVIFSHSSAYELCNSNRNVPDSILELIVQNRGLVMINFFSKFLTCSENATIQHAIDHINHIKNVAGIDYVGLGSGFDGINHVPTGLEDVSTYPILFAELLGNGWTIDELTKLAGHNFLRVLTEVENIRDKKKLAGVRPFEDILVMRSQTSSFNNCTNTINS